MVGETAGELVQAASVSVMATVATAASLRISDPKPGRETDTTSGCRTGLAELPCSMATALAWLAEGRLRSIQSAPARPSQAGGSR